MLKHLRRLIAVAAVMLCIGAPTVSAHEQAIAAFLNRIGGEGAADRFVTELVERPDGARESFTISSEAGKPKITGNSLSAITTGIGWYLNHTAGINLAWNRLTTDLSTATLPLPSGEETHTVAADFRHYLNYCTFSYSMSTWTWKRWEQEIDWMALHGINAPLQIIGLEEVWRKLLMEDYNYTEAEANAFVGGPCFMAWFGMNNLQGHGGPNPSWWYTRQAQLGKKMVDRMHELGIEPVLPGFAGMVPSNFTSKTGITAVSQGNWCGFQRPFILATDTEGFRAVSDNYYKQLDAVFGKSDYYSIDPFHEGGSTGGVDGAQAYTNLYNALDKAETGSKWVIQQWQWGGEQWKSVREGVIPKGRFIVLDLYSDGKGGSQLNSYNGHQTAYCMIPNFGARTGLFGRVQTLVDSYWKGRGISSVNGVAAVPEGIEQVPMLYDLLYEMAWMNEKPDPATWVAEWAKNRYGGTEYPDAQAAWELLRTSALDCKTGHQGPQEAITCARPSLSADRVSTWGGANLYYDANSTYAAAYKMLNAGIPADNENYSYDLADIARQALTDYSKKLLEGIKAANDGKDNELFAKRRDAFLQLILDIDELLNTNANFMLGHWTERARAMADEVAGTTDADRDWLEHDNARTLITTWGGQQQANGGGLHDYSYRQWGGMMKDFYYERWKQWFDNGMKEVSGGWYAWERAWAHNTKRYPTTPVGSTAEVAGRNLPKYLSPFTSKIEGQETRYIPRLLTTDLRKKLYDRASRGEAYTPDFVITGTTIADIAVDLDKNTLFSDGEVQAGGEFAVPADLAVGEYPVRVRLADGTELTYTLTVVEVITEPRTVKVATADAAQGSVSIDGTDALEVTNTEYVVLRATPTQKYDFDHWTDASGNDAGKDNPMTYYGKGAATFTAHFVENKWGVPDCSTYEKSAVETHKQWLKKISVTSDGNESDIYAADSAPEQGFVSVPTRVRAAPGGEFTVSYASPEGANESMFVTAYIDLDGDGEFDMDDKELLVRRGNFKSSLGGVGSGEFTVLLPFDTPLGTTHLRLRYDSSWNEGAYDSAVGAMKPKASTNRLIYEILVEIQESPEYASTVTASVSNPDLGSLRTENATNIYLPGEDVIITAFPIDGAHLEKFVDQHGRALPAEWITDNSIRFKPFGNAHITAVLALDPVTADGWEFAPETLADGSYRLASVVKEGGAVLDLSKISIPVTSIAADLFAGNTNLAEVTVPAGQLTVPGATLHKAQHQGDGTQNAKTNLDQAISGSTPWVMTIKGNTGANSYNQWGTPVYGNGTNALADNYSGGWSQFYLKNLVEGQPSTGRRLIIKWDGSSENSFDQVIISGAFTIRSEFDGANTLRVTVTNSDGQSQTKTIRNSSTMQAISRYATCLPEGMSFDLTFEEPYAAILPGELFSGCRNMEAFHAPDGGAYTERDGVLYDGAGKCVAYPEGRLFSRNFRLHDAEGKYVYTAPTFRGDDALDDKEPRRVKASADMAGSMLSIWSLVDRGEGGFRVTHANSLRNMGGIGGGGETEVNVPSNPNQWHGVYEYEIKYLEAEPVIDLFIGDRHLANGANQLDLSADDASGWYLEELNEVKATLVSGQDYHGIAFPVAVTVPEDAPFTVNIITAAADGSVTPKPIQPGANLAAFEPVVIRRGALTQGTVTHPGPRTMAEGDEASSDDLAAALPVYYGAAPQPIGTDNLLQTTKSHQTAMPDGGYFIVGGTENKMLHKTDRALDPNTPYLTVAKAEEANGSPLTDAAAGMDFSPAAVLPSGITIKTPEADIYYEVPADGQTIAQQIYQFAATVTPANSVAATIAWSVEEGPAVINEASGVLTPTGVGKATVKATLKEYPDIAATAEVTIMKKDVPCTAIELSARTFNLLAGQTASIKATASPANHTSGSISYISSDTNVATVANDGTVTAVGAGTATITVKCGDATAEATVYVSTTASGLNFANPALAMKVGTKQTVTATLAGEHTVAYTISYASSDAQVATVNASTGEIMALEKGKTTVTATATPAEGSGAATLTASMTVTVTYPEIAFTVTPEAVTINVGRTHQLTVRGVSGVGVTYAFSSSDEDVATVASNGVITGVAAGTADISVIGTDRDGNKVEVSVPVTVKVLSVDVDNAVVLDATSMNIRPGSVVAISATVSDAVRDYVRSMAWKSSNTAVAAVEDGVVTALASGCATITCTVTLTDGTVCSASCEVNVIATVVGIDEINADSAEGRTEIYDLAGRRIKRVATAGVYIVNGVKTLVR